jgi:signal transduction histidine kinase
MPPIPIMRHGIEAATLLVAAGEPRRWSEGEIEMCREAAERGWVAVERARAERALRELAATLEQRVEQRTAELQAAEAALRQAQKMEAVGQLTGGIAHDFNNMLSVVIGGVGLAQRRLARGDTAIGRFLDAAHEGAERAAALTQRLLAFSRQQPLRPQALDPGGLVAGMSELLSRALGEQIQIETRLEGGLWQVCVDPAQLENAVLNLAVNARDAMDGAGLLRIEVSNKPCGSDGLDHVVIAVTDTGSGMTQEVAARAFDPFFTTKAVGRGSGLGLSQVYGFASQSGGRAVIRSAPGEGTTVSLVLKRHHDQGSPRVAARAAPEATPPNRGETVLVVEDDDRVRQLSIAAVRELGYTVLHAASGQAALDMLAANKSIELLLTDIVMPGMNGRELAEEARRRHPKLRVLYTSGFSRNTLTPEADLLPKPFTLEQLATRIDAVMARAG